MSVRTMTEERLLLLLSAAEQQQKSVDKALQILSVVQKNAVDQEAQRIVILERHAFLLDGNLDIMSKLLALLPHWLVGVSLSFVIGVFLGIVFV